MNSGIKSSLRAPVRCLVLCLVLLLVRSGPLRRLGVHAHLVAAGVLGLVQRHVGRGEQLEQVMAVLAEHIGHQATGGSAGSLRKDMSALRKDMSVATARVGVPHGMVTLCFRAFPLHAAPDRPEERPADPTGFQKGAMGTGGTGGTGGSAVSAASSSSSARA